MTIIKTIFKALGFTGATPPTGYTPINEARAQITIGADTAQVPLVVSVDESGNPIAPLTDAQLRAGALAVSGPVTDQQLRAAALPVSLASLPAFAAIPTVNLGALNGAATDATLTAIKNAIQAQIQVSGSLWTDNSGAYYVRKDNVNQSNGSITVTFSDANGATAVPGAGLKPVNSTDSEVLSSVYDATAAGTGYALGDVLIDVSIINTSANPPTAVHMWLNRTQSTVLTTVPPASVLSEHRQAVQIAGTVPVTMAAPPAGAATDAAITTLNASIAALTKHIAIQNLVLADAFDSELDLADLLNDPDTVTY